MGRFIKTLFKIAAGLILLIILSVTACILLGITIDLSNLRPGVETAATAALGRRVTIEGPVTFEFSTWPAIDVRDISIANVPGGTSPTFFKAGHARLKLALLPLLKKEVRIGEVRADDIILNLESDKQGHGNWSFGKSPENTQKPGESRSRPVPGIAFTGLDKLSLKNITATYFDAALKKTVSFHLSSMEGKASPGKPMALTFQGSLQTHPYNLKILGGPVEELLDKSRPWTFSLTGEIAGKKIDAKGNLAARADIPRINLSFDVRDVNVGNILSSLGIVKGLEASVGDVGFNLSLQGENLKQVLKNSKMTFAIKKGKWKFTFPKTKTQIEMTNLSGAILVDKGKPVAVDLKGFLDKTPLKLKIVGASLLDFVAVPDNFLLLIDVELAKTRLHFSSKMALPMSSQNLVMTLKISGDRLDRLNNVLRLALPAIGPVSLDTTLAITRNGYDLSKLRVEVGKSQLNGKVKLNLSNEKPVLKASLVSDLIRIDDFVFKNEGTKEKQSETDSPSSTATEEIKGLLSHDFLNHLNADIRVEAKKVTFRKDNLGAALVVLSLKDGRLKIAPVRVDIPGGSIKLGLNYSPTPRNIMIHLKANIDKFDFGILARRAKPGTKMGGKLSLNAELRSTAPNLQQMMKTARGYFNFFLVPKNFSSGIIDLWAVNLLSAIMTKATEKDKSKINCLVVGLEIKNGLMKEKTIYMDTTKMRIVGKAQIDFKTRKIDVVLSPKAKRPEFFSLAVPVRVHGTIDDFNLGVNKMQLIGSVVSFITSPIHVPFRRLFSKQAPANGRKACLEAWKKTKADPIKPEP